MEDHHNNHNKTFHRFPEISARKIWRKRWKCNNLKMEVRWFLMLDQFIKVFFENYGIEYVCIHFIELREQYYASR